MNIYRNIAIFLSAAFILYALARLSGIGMLAAQVTGVIDNASARGAVELLQTQLPAMNEKAFVALPFNAYIGASAVMGVVLLAGAIVGLFGRVQAMIGVYGYYVLFALMFINYQTFNAKLIHLAVGLALAILLHFLLIKGKQKPSVQNL
ncbi:hypothetical protein K1X12_01040 [Hyphomonas sp. WL0036]|uniref:hypothetical protein n=1 Tax=Hyphomonas sediminis TaxID=2866160 RepID=UPI001C7E4947|nr:hypothetical protein [Hyphomonas sediminis]MBY9065462.1 hypothetical protein [Hyphomonas sediminis]